MAAPPPPTESLAPILQQIDNQPKVDTIQKMLSSTLGVTGSQSSQRATISQSATNREPHRDPAIVSMGHQSSSSPSPSPVHHRQRAQHQQQQLPPYDNSQEDSSPGPADPGVPRRATTQQTSPRANNRAPRAVSKEGINPTGVLAPV